MNRDQTEWTRPDTAQDVQAEFLITDLENVRVVADPIRLRILELLVVEPLPVKRLAATLKLPQTKLYYHMNMLEERRFIQVVGTRLVSGIVEKLYGATAYSYRVDENLFSVNAPGRDDTVDLMLSTMLDSVRNDILQSLSTGLIDMREDAPPERKITLGRVPMRLTLERAAELHRRLDDVIKEFCPDPDALGKPAPGTHLYHLFVTCFPTEVADVPEDG